MNLPPVVSPEEWSAAREALDKDGELDRMIIAPHG